MKTSEKRIIVSLAFALALGIGTQAFALDDTAVDVTGNDLVGAQTGGTAANDGSTAIGEVEVKKSTETSTQNDSENKAEDGSAAANNSSTAIGKINVDKSTNIDVDKKTETENKAEDGSAAAQNDSTAIGKIDKSTNIDVDKKTETENKAEDGSAAAQNGSTANADSYNDNSNQDNSKDKTQNADSYNDTNSYNDTAKAKDNGVALVDSEDVTITKDSLNGNIGAVEGGSVVATNGSTAAMVNSNNIDESTNATADHGGVAVNGDNAVNTVTQDSYNNKADNGSASTYGGGDAEVLSHNTINSDNTTTTVKVGNVAIEVATSVLEGQVSGNTLTAPADFTLTTGNNKIDGASVNATGITVLSQNTGVQAQVQQAVTVQYNQ